MKAEIKNKALGREEPLTGSLQPKLAKSHNLEPRWFEINNFLCTPKLKPAQAETGKRQLYQEIRMRPKVAKTDSRWYSLHATIVSNCLNCEHTKKAAPQRLKYSNTWFAGFAKMNT